jgi:hypothetical protein
MCYEGFIFEDFSCTYIRIIKQLIISPLVANYFLDYIHLIACEKFHIK